MAIEPLNFKPRSLADPGQLIVGWPADYWESYKHPTMQGQLDRAMAMVKPRLVSWMGGHLPDCPGFLLHGKPGYGKSATGLALLLCAARWGFSCRFVTAAHLAAERESTTYSARDGQTALALLESVLAPMVLMVDDIGTREYSPQARELFFDAVRERHSRKSITILTTNLKLGADDNTEAEKAAAAQGAQLFARSVDARVLSTYNGWTFNAARWGSQSAPAKSLRG